VANKAQSNARAVSEASEVERLAREVAEHRTELEALRAENAANRAALAAVQAQVGSQHTSPGRDAALGQRGPSARRRLGRRRSTGSGERESSGLMSRRRLFGLLGGAAAAGAGLAVIGSAGDPAGAVNPNLILDQTNTGNATTDLTADLTNATTLTVENTSTTNAGGIAVTVEGLAAGVQATSNGTGSAIAGVASPGGIAGFFSCTSGTTDAGAALRLFPASFAGHPTGGSHDVGEFLVDSDGLLFACIAGGTPGAWLRQSPLVTIPPARIYDSRISGGSNGSNGSMAPAGSTTNLDVTVAEGGSSGVPATASAVLGNLTTTQSAGPGFMTVWAAGTTQPGTSNVNMTPNLLALPNNFTSACGTGGDAHEISVLCAVSSTHFIVDLFGYYP